MVSSTVGHSVIVISQGFLLSGLLSIEFLHPFLWRMLMKLSARNQFQGKVKTIKFGNVMAEVVVDIGGGHEVVSAITRGSAEQLGLTQGATVTVVVKATEVILAKD
jgi:molybdopterin-binding protein